MKPSFWVSPSMSEFLIYNKVLVWLFSRYFLEQKNLQFLEWQDFFLFLSELTLNCPIFDTLYSCRHFWLGFPSRRSCFVMFTKFGRIEAFSFWALFSTVRLFFNKKVFFPFSLGHCATSLEKFCFAYYKTNLGF